MGSLSFIEEFICVHLLLYPFHILYLLSSIGKVSIFYSIRIFSLVCSNFDVESFHSVMITDLVTSIETISTVLHTDPYILPHSYPYVTINFTQ